MNVGYYRMIQDEEIEIFKGSLLKVENPQKPL